ncbi:cbb3-type cytochrome oxidase assembly protein CcoS [Colwellia echini]|uniref:Cbb3-type cytochrome oxidase assembly protein CcoS n=1 Tax=Colwellia echini TaxID=1982103 RepID=A0ABY3MU37_9GAMM|nr:cbb3-type cytochrome oxidase assembly protein CcoS [Colwellia echini]TYK64699.1 cbb3-type cytochrome oxidase assembly protein CcoS [Colwellia echini]
MSIIYILIPIAIIFTALGIYFFFWAVKTEQFDDLEKQGMSILFDDEQRKNNTDEISIEKQMQEIKPEVQSDINKPN